MIQMLDKTKELIEELTRLNEEYGSHKSEATNEFVRQEIKEARAKLYTQLTNNEHMRISYLKKVMDECGMEICTAEYISKVIETREPRGKWICFENEFTNGVYVAVDNTTGDAWTEYWGDVKHAIRYLNGESTEDIIDSINKEAMEEAKPRIKVEAIKRLQSDVECSIKDEVFYSNAEGGEPLDDDACYELEQQIKDDVMVVDKSEMSIYVVYDISSSVDEVEGNIIGVYFKKDDAVDRLKKLRADFISNNNTEFDDDYPTSTDGFDYEHDEYCEKPTEFASASEYYEAICEQYWLSEDDENTYLTFKTNDDECRYEAYVVEEKIK